MKEIRTATGRVFESDYVTQIRNPGRAFIRVNASISVVAEVFSNPEETSEIWYGDKQLNGYTRLVAIVPEGSMIKVCLGKEN